MTPTTVAPAAATRAAATLVVPLLLLAGCGTDTGSPRSTTTPTPSPTSPATSDSGVPDARTVAIVTVTGAGGRPSPLAVRLDTPAAIDAFGAEFAQRGMRHRLRTEAADASLGPGEVLVGAVVALGCGVPDTLVVTDEGGRLMIAAGPIEDSPQECFAPMTSVGLVAVPEAVAPPVPG